MQSGIINIYKEKGFTSHDVVAKVRGILRERKIGHTGTLDPDAEGVLPICIGKATKVVPYLTDADKCYEAVVRLGAYTTTEDASGEIIESFQVNVTKEQVLEVIKSFEGAYIQTPPMYSAIKVNGVRLYELARKGIVVERPSREVNIMRCELIEWIDETSFKIVVDCSKGTYIRTLCTDIGKKLGCGAYMESLLRTRVGNFHLDESITLSTLEANKLNVEPFIHTIEALFKEYEAVTIKPEYNKYLYNGNPLTLKAVEYLPKNDKPFLRVYDEKGQFIGLYKINESSNQLVMERNFM